MPSPNTSKINADNTTKLTVRQQGKREGLTMTRMLAKMVLYYMQHSPEAKK